MDKVLKIKQKFIVYQQLIQLNIQVYYCIGI